LAAAALVFTIAARSARAQQSTQTHFDGKTSRRVSAGNRCTPREWLTCFFRRYAQGAGNWRETLKSVS